jgi:outer membrane protein TolC
MKSENSLKQFGEVAKLETSSAQAAYNNALRSFVIQKSNIELAQKVLNTVRIKEREGIAGNLELITAQTTLNQSENNMYDALYNYYIARVDLDKALGNIK